MKLLKICISLLLIAFSGCQKKQPEWKQVFNQLNQEQKEILDLFFRVLIEKTSSGYTLFGHKPLSIEGITSIENHSPTCLKFYDEHDKVEYILKLGLSVFDSLPIKSSRYFFVVSEDAFCGTKELSIGNRKRLQNQIEEKLSLFQYILGPKFLVEDFFHEIEQKRQSIFSLFHANRVLVGIVLGFGVKNALMQSRNECIEDQFYSLENFLPLKSAQMKVAIPVSIAQKSQKNPEFFIHKVHLPSFSFSSLSEEKKWLGMDHKLSLKQSMKESKASFPCFGYWDSEESQELIESYQKTQKLLNKILESDCFLEIIFDRIFGE